MYKTDVNMNVYSVSFRLLVILITAINVEGYCLFGNGPNCAFPCRCNITEECQGDGTCKSGCQRDNTEFRTRWSGPSCQIGNVAFSKSANQTQKPDIYLAGKATDGKKEIGTTFEHCAEANALNYDGYEFGNWWVDLGDIHKIHSVTIHNRKEARFAKRMEQFKIHISNSSTEEELCVDRIKAIPAGVGTPLPCQEPLVGQYVHIYRYGGYEPYLLELCEVIVIGHKYIDCKTCPDGVSCNDVIGCSACTGSFQPTCIVECEDRRFGRNCAEKCGNCSEGLICNKTTGGCPQGCQMWWADNTCKTEIVLPSLSNETESFQDKAVSGDSVQLSWIQMYSVPDSLAAYYQYSVKYRTRTAVGRSLMKLQTEYKVYKSIPHDSSVDMAEVTVTGLEHNTEYALVVVPQRVMAGTVEDREGTQYGPITRKTRCIDPVVSDLNLGLGSDTQSDQPVIVVTYQNLSLLDSGCDNIVDASVQYRDNDTLSNYTRERLDINSNTHTLYIEAYGQYHVKLYLVNNDNRSRWSPEMSVTVEEINKPGVPVATIVSVVIVIIVLVVTVVLAVCFYRRRKTKYTKNEASADCTSRLTASALSGTNTDAKGSDNPMFPGLEGGGSQRKGSLAGVKPEFTPKPSGSSNQDTAYDAENIYVNNTVLSLDMFEDYVMRRKQDMDDFKAEYEGLPQDDPSRCPVGQTEVNKKKNRFKNIFPYDDTRVMLQTDGADDRSYINANYITGYNTAQEYIATQGPLNTTVTDFWAMIWQEKANRIVMVANLKENGKQRCHPYWSKDIGTSVKFGPFTVTTEASEACADYVTSVLTVHSESEQMTVRHFHFTTWVDKNKPLYGATSLLAFYRKVHSFDNISKGPLVVHCSAGVGRTGTFIVLDSLMKKIKAEGTVDVMSCVQRARMERMTMVQTKAQYFYIHDVLVEFIKCGDTSQSCTSFQNTFRELDQKQAGRGPIDKQFKLLCENRETTRSISKDGLLEIHINKNRNKAVIPNDSVRVHLPGKEEDSYINAVFVDSFKAHDYHVVTQMPLPHTLGDFWRLVHNQQTRTIIMLNQIQEDTETCEPYWPADGSTRVYGGVDVALINTKTESKSLVTRDFKVSIQRRGQRSAEQTIRQFQLLTWPDDTSSPPNPGDLLDLVDHVIRWQHKTSSADTPAGEVLVHCVDGVNHSGMYCALTYMLDRMKLEQDVDPFLAAKSVSRNRPEFFGKSEQYRFLFKMAAEYLSRNNEYANF